MAKKTDIETVDPTPLAVAEDFDYSDFAGEGFENQTSEDYAIPFLELVQTNSKQITVDDDLRPGMIRNTGSGDKVKGAEGVVFVPCSTKHVYVEWRPRDAGGGIAGQHDSNAPVVQECKATQPFGKYKTPEGNDLIETFYVYGLQVDADGVGSQCVVAFSSTKIKAYKRWMTKAKLISVLGKNGRRTAAPLFSHRYRLTSTKETNPKGDFFNWVIDFDGASAREARLPASHELFQQAYQTKLSIQAGDVKVNYQSQDVETATEEAPF